MRLQELKLENFRNYAAAELLPDENINLICGLNAQGKSNLLEAVCYLGLASSFRGAPDSELIRWEQPYFFLRAAAVHADGSRLLLTAAANRRRQRRWTLDHQPLSRLSDAIGRLPAVIFAPEDVMLVKSGPEARRRYLNRQLSQIDRPACRRLIRYNQVLSQRNACLKQGESVNREQLELWDAELARYGAAVSRRRYELVRQLEPLACRLHAELSGGEQLQLSYQSSLLARAEKEGVPAESEQLEPLMVRELLRLRQPELLRGTSLLGPHRDELHISIEGRPARDFASQGQQRTAALALKAAELELAAVTLGEYPLLLLDDALSELDARRRRQIISLVRGHAQTFITATDDDLFPHEGRRFRIAAGKISSG